MSYIEWELAQYPEHYKRLRCNQVIDEVTLTHVICNVDCPEGMMCLECSERPMSKKVAEKLGIKPITTAKYVPEHDGCEGCRWMDKHEDDEPCKNCCGVRGGSAPDLWEER